MEYLQVSDPGLRRALVEYLEMSPAGFGVTEDAGAAELRAEDARFILTAEGKAIEEYIWPVRLPVLVAELRWFFTQRAERANREINLGGGYFLYPHEFRLRHDGAEAALTGREVALLQFMARVGECSKETLLAEVWRYHPESDTHTVETHLWRLRQKLQQAGMTAPLIATTDLGYRLS